MGASPIWKVYNDQDEYIASTKYVEDAAVLISANMGGTIRNGHAKANILWTEGAEDFPAGESYDGVAQVVHQRIQERVRKNKKDTM